MTKKMLLFRHGACAEGFEDVCKGGGTDCDLSPEGLMQTKENVLLLLEQARGDLNNVLVVTSGLKRTNAFGEICHQMGASNVHVDSDLRDIDAGDWEGMTWPNIRESWLDQYQKIKDRAHELVLPNGEPIAEFVPRIQTAWRKWVEFMLKHDFDCAAVVGHRATNDVILAGIQDRQELSFASQQTACVNEIEIDADGYATVISIDRVRESELPIPCETTKGKHAYSAAV